MMRKAVEFVEEYRRKGYPDERIRIIASMRPEPLRSEVLRLLAAAGHRETGEGAGRPDEGISEGAAAAPEPPSGTGTPAAEASMPATEDAYATLRRERDDLARQLEGAREEIKKLRKSADAADKDLRRRIGEIEAVVAEKETLLGKKDAQLAQLNDELAAERAARAERDATLAEVQARVEEQAERIRELSEIESELAAARAEVEELRRELAELRKREQANVARVQQLESSLEAAGGEADELRRQIQANEQALEALQDKLDARDAELETLRDHFEKEARDLQKRAEQEVWLVRRRLARFRRVAAVVGVAAAALVVMLFAGLVSRSGAGDWRARARELQARVGELESLAETFRHDRDVALSQLEAAQREARTARAPRKAETPAPIPAVIRAPGSEVPAAAMREYIVQKGDSPWRIAEKVYGDGAKYRLILEANSLGEGQYLQPGMKLRIPPEAGR